MPGLLLVTHGQLGADMLETAREILTDYPLEAESIAVHGDSDPDQLYEQASKACERLDDGGGVMIVTDLFGSTPSNIANRLIETHNACVIAGANIPMLLRIINYQDLGLDALCEKACSGARDGIVANHRRQGG